MTQKTSKLPSLSFLHKDHERLARDLGLILTCQKKPLYA